MKRPAILVVEDNPNAGRVLTHEQLLEHAWGPDYSEAVASLRTFIKQLRRKLEPDPACPRHLLTEPGVGYRLVGGDEA